MPGPNSIATTTIAVGRINGPLQNLGPSAAMLQPSQAALQSMPQEEIIDRRPKTGCRVCGMQRERPRILPQKWGGSQPTHSQLSLPAMLMLSLTSFASSFNFLSQQFPPKFLSFPHQSLLIPLPPKHETLSSTCPSNSICGSCTFSAEQVFQLDRSIKLLRDPQLLVSFVSSNRHRICGSLPHQCPSVITFRRILLLISNRLPFLPFPFE